MFKLSVVMGFEAGGASVVVVVVMVDMYGDPNFDVLG